MTDKTRTPPNILDTLTEEDRKAFENSGVVFATNSAWRDVGLMLWAKALDYAQTKQARISAQAQQLAETLSYPLQNKAPVMEVVKDDNMGKGEKTDFCSANPARGGAPGANAQHSRAFLEEQPDKNCTHCQGEGVVDSGGSTPWGEAIEVPCGCLSRPSATTSDALAFAENNELPILQTNPLCVKRDADLVEQASDAILLTWAATIAQAVGLPVKRVGQAEGIPYVWDKVGYKIQVHTGVTQSDPLGDFVYIDWNPLYCDEDAHYLAAALAKKFPVKFSSVADALKSAMNQCASFGDPYEGTRRALVKCVARGDFC